MADLRRQITTPDAYRNASRRSCDAWRARHIALGFELPPYADAAYLSTFWDWYNDTGPTGFHADFNWWVKKEVEQAHQWVAQWRSVPERVREHFPLDRWIAWAKQMSASEDRPALVQAIRMMVVLHSWKGVRTGALQPTPRG